MSRIQTILTAIQSLLSKGGKQGYGIGYNFLSKDFPNNAFDLCCHQSYRFFALTDNIKID